MINADRKEAARLFKNNDESRARSFAESSIRNKRIVTALSALCPLCSALFQRSEPLAGYTSLVQIPEPARSGIITIIYAAGRLQMSYLTDTVQFLRDQFATVHIDQIQRGEGDLIVHVNSTVRDALAPATASREEVDSELASAVREYFGIAVRPGLATGPASTYTPKNVPGPDHDETPQDKSEHPRATRSTSPDTMRKSQTTPLSVHSSDAGVPMSPELRQQDQIASGPIHERNIHTPSPPKRDERTRLYAGNTAPPGYAPPEDMRSLSRPDGLSTTVDIGVMQRATSSQAQNGKEVHGASSSGEPYLGTTAAVAGGPNSRVAAMVRDQEHARLLQEKSQDELLSMPEHLRMFEDSDVKLFERYEHLRAVIAV